MRGRFGWRVVGNAVEEEEEEEEEGEANVKVGREYGCKQKSFVHDDVIVSPSIRPHVASSRLSVTSAECCGPARSSRRLRLSGICAPEQTRAIIERDFP